MDFKPKDVIKMKKEVLEKTARQRSRGKEVDGKWISFKAIEEGRGKNEFEVASIVGEELYLRWKREDNIYIYLWVHGEHFELKGIVESEEF